MSEAARHTPAVSGHQVLAAGLASTTAAIVTSKFGVAGTLLGAALTSMIITGGGAVLKAYLESVTGRVSKMPSKIQARANRHKAGRVDAPTIPGRPDLRENFMGRLRASLDWFSHLPTFSRRSIMLKGFVAAIAAFVIGLVAITGAEALIGNNLSCGLWSKCAVGASPGVHPLGLDGTGAKSTFSGGGAKTYDGTSQDTSGTQTQGGSNGLSNLLNRQDSNTQQEVQQAPSDSGVQPADPSTGTAPQPSSGTDTQTPTQDSGVPAPQQAPAQQLPAGGSGASPGVAGQSAPAPQQAPAAADQ